MADTTNNIVTTEKTVTCPVEKSAQLVLLMNQLGLAPKSAEAGAEPNTVVIKADMTDAQAKDLQALVAKLERRETVASVLHKAGGLATKTIDFTVNDVARPLAGVGLQLGAGIVGSAVKFSVETGARLVNEIADTGVKTVQSVRVSEDAQKFKGSLSAIGSCFGLFDGKGDSSKIKIA